VWYEEGNAATIMLMVFLPVFIALAGTAFGSFVDAITWRLHTKRNFVSDRSECEHCHHKLGPLDLIPIVSWMMLGGKCRYCKKPITPLAPLTELAMGALFLASYLFWPLGFESWQGIALFALWLTYLVSLGILFVYDLRWGLLPDVIVYPLVVLGLVDAALRISLTPGAGVTEYASHVVLGVAAMAGIYGTLYMVSRGKWVGFGDVKLAVFMGAVLGWEKTLLVLMLANVIGLLIVAPGLLSKKLTPKSHIPFGPFMIAAFVIAGLAGDAVIRWYLESFVLI
jgi:prepilin signal peptidase PulO-like enzyme (type II secretory pathway)